MGAAATCTPEVGDCNPERCATCDRACNGSLSSQYVAARDTLSRIVVPTTANLRQAEEDIPIKGALAISVIGRRVRDFGAEEGGFEEQGPKDPAKRKLNERLIEVAREGNYKKVVAAITDGADLNFRTLRKQTALIVAATSFNKTTKELINFLIDALSDIEARDDQGWTPLLHACRNNQKEVCGLLLEKKASIKARSMDGKTATMLATLEKSDHLVVDLVNGQAQLDKKDNRGWPILFFACEGGRQELVKWLLKKMVSVKDKAKDFTTPLMVAAETGHTNIGQMLLKRSAHINGSNSAGYTALMLALKAQKEEFADWLLDLDPKDYSLEVSAVSKGAKEDAAEIADSLGMNALRHKLVARVRHEEENAEREAAEKMVAEEGAAAAADAEAKTARSPRRG